VGLVDLVDLVRQIYNVRELVRKVLMDAGGELAELRRLLGETVELPSVDIGDGFDGRLVIEKYIGELRPLPPWLRLAGKYPFMYLRGGIVIVDSLALHVSASGATLRLKLWYEEASTMGEGIYEPDEPGRRYSSVIYDISMPKSNKSSVPLETLLVFVYLTTDEEWKCIIDELEELAASRMGLDKVISQLKAAMAALRLVS
jgi:hypothetical protein